MDTTAAAAASGSLIGTLISMTIMAMVAIGFVGMIISGIMLARNASDEEKMEKTRKRFFVFLWLFLVPLVIVTVFVTIAARLE